MAGFSAWLELGGERLQEVQETPQISDLGSWVSKIYKFKEFVSPSYVSDPELDFDAKPVEEMVQGRSEPASDHRRLEALSPSLFTFPTNPRAIRDMDKISDPRITALPLGGGTRKVRTQRRVGGGAMELLGRSIPKQATSFWQISLIPFILMQKCYIHFASNSHFYHCRQISNVNFLF